MKNKKPTKLKTHPEQKLPNDKGNKPASAKKALSKDNRPLAVIHSIFQAKNRTTKRTFTVLVALCAEGQNPWESLNLGKKIGKDAFESQLKRMKPLDDV
jgi:hypothetical protein